MAKAKNTVTVEPVEPQPKQIVLTQEQYDTLITIYDTLNDVKDEIENLVNDDENTQIQLGYQLGIINGNVNVAFDKLDELTDAITLSDNDWDDEDEDVDGGFSA
jgi:hypothetical protein